ncbi:tail fiber protein [Vibrio phage vB_ValC_WD615]|nr:tail fiber protein [Vibrio phage vB_ValC_WD615]
MDYTKKAEEAAANSKTYSDQSKQYRDEAEVIRDQTQDINNQTDQVYNDTVVQATNADTSASNAATSAANAATSAANAEQSYQDTLAVVPSLQSQIDEKATKDELNEGIAEAQEELLPPGSKIYPEVGVLSNGMTVTAGITHLRVLVGGKPTIVAMSPVSSGVVSLLTGDGATIGATSVDFIPFYSSFTLRFDSIANMLAGIPVRSEVGDICIVLDTSFKHESGDGFSITDFKPLSYRGGEAYEKTTIELLRNELSGVVDPALLQYGSRKLVNNPDFTDTIEDVANFAGQTLGSSAPIGWIHHHYTDGIMHQWDNVGDGTMLYLKNAQNPGRRPDKPSSYVGQGKFLSLGTEGFVGVGSERFFISPEVEFVYKQRQVAKFLSDLDPNDGDGFAFITSCYRAMELVQKWSSNGDNLMYVRRAPNGQPQFRLFKSGTFGTDGTILDLSTQNGGTVRILTGPTSSNIDAGAGDLNLRPSLDAGAGVYANGPLKLKKYTTGDLPALAASARALAWDITQDALVKWNGTSWVAV